MYLYMMNKKAFVKKYVRDPIVLAKVEKRQTYCMIDYTEPIKYTEVIAMTDGKDLYNESLLVKDIHNDNNITELFPTAASETVSGEGQTLHELKPMSLPKTAKSRKRRSVSPRVMTARRSRSSKGGLKHKLTGRKL
jgi:hypothetical protein